MKCPKIVILLTALLFPLLSWADATTDQLVHLLGQLNSLQANFVQTVQDKNGRALQQTAGKMALQRPGKFRWQTLTPSKQLLIADGQQVWFYDVDLAQITTQKQQTTNKNSPAMLLSGSVQTLTQDFHVMRMPSSNPNQQIFKLSPRATDGMFHIVQLTFNNNQLTQMQMQDNFGQTTLIQFSQVKTNLALNPALFHFVSPKGVDVIQS